MNDKKNPSNTRFIPTTIWPDFHPWPGVAGLRNLVFNRRTNGFDNFGVVKKVGKRVLIDESAFFEWVKNNETN